MKKKLIALILFVLQILISLSLAYIFTGNKNTLDNNPNWKVSKQNLEIIPMNSFEFSKFNTALADASLNLATWSGFQEVLASQAWPMQKISFDYYLEQDAYLYFIFNKNEQGFKAFKISGNFNNPYQIIEASASGQFIKSSMVPPSSQSIIPKSKQWNHLEIDFRDWPKLLDHHDQLIAFRSGNKTSKIDNIRVFDQNNQLVFEEKFWPKQLFLKYFVVCLAFISLVNLVIFLWQKNNFFLILINASLLVVCLLILLLNRFWFWPRYPNPNSFFASWSKNETAKLEDIFFYTDLALAEKQQEILDNNLKVKTIMFLGSSQTRGEGASIKGNSFVEKFIGLLNQTSNQKFIAFNTGLSGLDSSELVSHYINYWSNIPTDFLIVNLSSNDCSQGRDVKKFAEELQTLIDFNFAQKNKKTQLIFLVEAESKEVNSEESIFQKTMKEIAVKNKIPLLDTHQHLLTQNDTGILWWDFVHPTDYGHQLIAEYLYANLKELILN